MQEMTTAQQLLPVKLAIGRPVYLRPYESVLSYKITDDEVTLSIRTYETTETVREIRFHKCGIRLRTWKPDELGIWKEQFLRDADHKIIPFVVWDDDFKPYVECRFGHSLTPEEYHDRLLREAMTYRPGTPRTPLDSFERTAWASRNETTPEMYRYWVGHERELFELGDDDGTV